MEGRRQSAASARRTIHPDGTIVPLTVKPEDLLIEKDNSTQIEDEISSSAAKIERKVLHCPAWRSEAFSSIPFSCASRTSNSSSPDQSGSCRRSISSIRRITSLHAAAIQADLAPVLPEGVTAKQGGFGDVDLDVKDIPPTPTRSGCRRSKASFTRCTSIRQARQSQAWTTIGQTEGKYWSKDADTFAEPTKPIRDAVAGLVAPGDSDLVKAQETLCCR